MEKIVSYLSEFKLDTLYFMFVTLLLLVSLLWWILTKVKYFGSLFISGAIIFPLFYFTFNYLKKINPEAMESPVFVKLTPLWKTFLCYAAAGLGSILVGSFLLLAIYFFLLRKLIAKINEFMFKHKIRLFETKEEKIKKVSYDVQEYFSKNRFFVGLNKNKKPVYLSPTDLTTHIQVVGPSGVGKTVSTLFPLAVQCLLQGYPLIFVDGKGDAKLKTQLYAFCKKMGIKMYFFDTLQPDYSHTYNPLVGSSDPNELTNLLAVGLNLNAPGEAKVYTDIQKKFLSTLLHLFVETKQKFNFCDVVEYINHREARDIVYQYITDDFYKNEMIIFLSRLSKNERELIGLATILDQLFVSDEKIFELINTYEPDINIRKILQNGGAVLFSFSAGMKAQTNEALAKMVLADIANAVGERHASFEQNHQFAMIVLDEFGQYVSESFDKFISTARSANVACILSHQTNAQLETYFSKDRLARVVRENTSGKIIFRQSEEASFWAETFGTKQSVKRTEQVETGAMLTEKISTMGSLREVDEFIIHPNALRKLEVGQAVWKFKDQLPEVISLGMFNPASCGTKDVKFEKVEHKMGEGLNLREKRKCLVKIETEEKEQKQKEQQKQTTENEKKNIRRVL
jgi:type IV secretory pathway TraG/TraD family ATPase VirD4